MRSATGLSGRLAIFDVRSDTREEVRGLLANDRFWPLAVPPGGAVQARVPPNNGLQDDAPASGARLKPNVRLLHIMKIPALEYQSVRSYNREIFFIEHGDLVKAFVAIDANFNTLLRLPGTMRDCNGKSHVSLIPFIFLLQRQAQSAFEALSAYQSYQAWVLLRPGIEAVLIVGKWVDDPQNAEIWKNRESHPQVYQRTYTGKGLRSKSLPNSESIQRDKGQV